MSPRHSTWRSWRSLRRKLGATPRAPRCGEGRIELTRWLREQSVSETRHRYGQLNVV